MSTSPIGQFIDLVKRERVTILVLTTVGLLFGIVVALVMRPLYQADVVLLPVEETDSGPDINDLAGQLGGLALLAGLPSGDTTRIEMLALLRSRAFTIRFIDEQGLLPVLFPEYWDAKRSAWIAGKNDQPTLLDGFEKFDEEVRSIDDDRITGLITLSIRWRDRALAATWANALIERLNEAARERAVRDSNQRLEYLNRELAKSNVLELQQAIYRLIETQVRTIMMASVRKEYAFRVIDPAMTPDEDQFVLPKRGLFIALGAFLGIALGLLAAYVRTVWPRS